MCRQVHSLTHQMVPFFPFECRTIQLEKMTAATKRLSEAIPPSPAPGSKSWDRWQKTRVTRNPRPPPAAFIACGGEPSVRKTVLRASAAWLDLQRGSFLTSRGMRKFRDAGALSSENSSGARKRLLIQVGS